MKIPEGRLRRAWDMARVGVRSGSALLTQSGGDAAAEQAALLLGRLRGLGAKVGQTLSYVDGLLPEEAGPVFGRTLAVLQSQTFASDPEAIRQMIVSELGAPLEACFSSFEIDPIASASIGQVHRAVLLDGQAVAVKVQHPGIESAVNGDLSNMALMQSILASFLPKGLDSRAMIAEISDRFREELDYLGEARRTQAFHDFFEDTPMLHIPQVISDRSTRRVLTTTFLEGAHLDAASACEPELREAYARNLWHFVFRGNLVGGAFQADPHPGNYLFRPDGTVACLDFGCVQPILESTRAAAIQMHEAAIAKEDARFARALREMLGTRGGDYERATEQFIRACFEPLFESPFRLSRDYVRRLTGSVAGMRKQVFSKDGSFVSPPPHLAMMNRLQFGFYSVLARLDIAVDYAAVESTIVKEARETQAGIISSRLASNQK